MISNGKSAKSKEPQQCLILDRDSFDKDWEKMNHWWIINKRFYPKKEPGSIVIRYTCQMNPHHNYCTPVPVPDSSHTKNTSIFLLRPLLLKEYGVSLTSYTQKKETDFVWKRLINWDIFIKILPCWMPLIKKIILKITSQLMMINK